MQRNILEPAVKAIYKETGHKYVGVLYAGVIVDSNQKVNVLEFNCRFGDPECEVCKINIVFNCIYFLYNVIILFL